MSKLPLELYDLIIPPLRKDRDSLKALSVSWRGFTSLAQCQLFSHVILRPRRNCVREYHDVSGAPSELMQLLDTSPHIGKYVKSLEISDWTNSHLERCDLHSKRASDCHLLDDSDLPSCLAYITNLQSLVMCYLHPKTSASPTFLHAIYQTINLPSLLHLELCCGPDLPILHSNIKHLVLPRRGHAGTLEHRTVPSDHPLELHSLCLKPGRGIRFDVEPLSRLGSGVSLQGLKRLVAIMDPVEEYFKALGNLLQSCRGSLEEFFLVGYYPPQPDVEPFLHLKCLPSLKRFHVKIMSIMDSEEEYLIDQLPWLIHFLRQSLTEPHRLEELSIEQYVFYTEHDAEAYLFNLAHGWRAATEILLNRSLLPRLRDFKLRIFSDDFPHQAARVVDFLKSCDFVKLLDSNFETVMIFAREFGCCIMADFVEDHEWLSMDDRYEHKRAQITIS